MNKEEPAISRKIAKKLQNAVPLRIILDVLNIINNYLYEEIIKGKPIYIDGFGTFSKRISSRKGFFAKQYNKFIKPTIVTRLYFRPHSAFLKLLKKKKSLFKTK